MKINSAKTSTQRNRQHHAAGILAILIVVGWGLNSTLAQMKSQKRITSVQIGEVAEGSRVSVFADSALTDYEAFRRGDRFYVRIPLADFGAQQPNFRGGGFEDVQVQRVGDSILISFKLELGATARVDQRSNRLDVIFSSPNKLARNGSRNPSSSRTAPAPIPGIVTLQSARSRLQRNPDAAGPMPPDSPAVNRPRIVTHEVNAERRAPEGSQRRNDFQASVGREVINTVNTRTIANPTPGTRNNSPSSADHWKTTNKSDSPSTFIPSATPSYTPSTDVTSSSPLSSSQGATSPPSTVSGVWKKRSEATLRWISENRLPASIGTVVLLSLVVFICAVFYRRRRRYVNAKRVNAPRIQPKYSPSPGLQEVRNDPIAQEYDLLFDDSASDVSQSEADVTLHAGTLNASRSFRVAEPAVAHSMGAALPLTRAWIPVSPSTPNHGLRNEEQEREVFEL